MTRPEARGGTRRASGAAEQGWGWGEGGPIVGRHAGPSTRAARVAADEAPGTRGAGEGMVTASHGVTCRSGQPSSWTSSPAYPP
eukprot:scaffold1130_cov127-Isochrysis_galbana.AAC.2